MFVSPRPEFPSFPRKQLAATAMFAIAAFAGGLTAEDRTADLGLLQRYVGAIDPAYKYTVEQSFEGSDYKAYVLRLVSQKWLDESLVDRPIWRHWLTVAIPNELEHDTAFLYISGGDNDDDAPRGLDSLLLLPMRATHSIVAELRQIPNQPLSFVGDERGPRNEDAIIAYGWRHFLEGGARDSDARWLARFPMTKAAVRAMDTVVEFAASEQAGTHSVRNFVVAGGSKRGWTTWTTALVDPRVVAIVPFVIDLLNVEPSFEHHYRAYGAWAPAVADYEREGIMAWQGTPEYRRLLDLVDPYEHRQQLALPKLLINATGDEFFLPDSWRFYYRDLPGEKLLRYVPNSRHSLSGTDAAATFLAFYRSVLDNSPRPSFDWTVDGDAIHVRIDPRFPPTQAFLWQAHNDKARDFRVDSIGEAWASTELPISGHALHAHMEIPDHGFTAFFVELVFPGSGVTTFRLTTGVGVVPDRLPFGRPPTRQ